MKVKNNLTRETLEITYPEFRKKFVKELQAAFESYRRTQLNKYSYNFKDDNSMKYNFYFQLHWNLRLIGRGLESDPLRARLTPQTKRSLCRLEWDFSFRFKYAGLLIIDEPT